MDGVGDESEFRLERGEVTTSSVKGVKPAGSIEISADRVILGDVKVKSDSKSDGGSGTLILEGRESLEIGPESEVTSVTEGSGPGGSVNLKGARVEIEGGLVATDTRSENEGAGDAGRIEVRADEFNILDGGRMSSVSEGRGGAGVVGVEAKSFRLSGSSTDKTSRVSSSTYYGREVEGAELAEGGSGGNISIKAEQLDVGKYGELLVETLGSGDGGTLRVEADRIKVSGKGARLSGQSGYKYKSQEWKSHEKARGRGGSIEIDAKTMEVSQRGEISVQTTGYGEGGSLDLKATEVLEVTGLRPKISANTYEAKGGSITMELGGLKITGANASIESNTRGGGLGGSIKIEGEGALFEIGKGGLISANAEGSGAGGSVLMKGGGLALVGGRIESNTEGSGSGGLIELRLTDSIEIEGIQKY